MKIKIFAEDDTLLDTIEGVHVNLKSQYGMGKLLDRLVHTYKNKYIKYMYEKYQIDRRSGDDRRDVS
jgi:hypothetical protein